MWFLGLPDVGMPQSSGVGNRHVTSISFFIWGGRAVPGLGLLLSSPWACATRAVSIWDGMGWRWTSCHWEGMLTCHHKPRELWEHHFISSCTQLLPLEVSAFSKSLCSGHRKCPVCVPCLFSFWNIQILCLCSCDSSGHGVSTCSEIQDALGRCYWESILPVLRGWASMGFQKCRQCWALHIVFPK